MLTCIWSKCSRPATYLAYSTVGGGDAHSCETHAPAWLKAGQYTAFYSPVPCEKDLELAHATARRLVPPYAVRKQLREATLGVGRRPR